ncbi:MAG TPA: glycosyltransferase, partial [Burkholderiaceae bacterium]|nr:glycosyltransferase [Burkholderiaceae bacterium]
AGASLVVLGNGSAKFEHALAELARRFPRHLGVFIGFSEALAHGIEAGADAFLMPSRFEPCGLNQMYSLAYGTPAVVHATGGLADTVVDCTPATLADRTATGFMFADARVDALLGAVRRACDAWADGATWRRLQQNGMRRDFGWRTSAQAYLRLYEELVQRRA